MEQSPTELLVVDCLSHLDTSTGPRGLFPLHFYWCYVSRWVTSIFFQSCDKQWDRTPNIPLPAVNAHLSYTPVCPPVFGRPLPDIPGLRVHHPRWPRFSTPSTIFIIDKHCWLLTGVVVLDSEHWTPSRSSPSHSLENTHLHFLLRNV